MDIKTFFSGVAHAWAGIVVWTVESLGCIGVKGHHVAQKIFFVFYSKSAMVANERFS